MENENPPQAVAEESIEETLSVEEVAMSEAVNLFHCYPFPNDNYTYEAVRKQYVQGAIFGANYIINSKGLVERDKVLKVLIDSVSQYELELSDDILSKTGIIHNGIRVSLLTNLIAQIKELK